MERDEKKNNILHTYIKVKEKNHRRHYDHEVEEMDFFIIAVLTKSCSIHIVYTLVTNTAIDPIIDSVVVLPPTIIK